MSRQIPEEHRDEIAKVIDANYEFFNERLLTIPEEATATRNLGIYFQTCWTHAEVPTNEEALEMIEILRAIQDLEKRVIELEQR